ncbi:MAG: DUF2516 family protein [Candidatus Nanopelagicales bacterium]
MLFDLTQNLVMTALWVLFLLLKVWAFVDCARRRSDAFPAVGRQSKTLWLVLTGIAALTAVVLSPLGLVGIAGLVVSLVYLFDIRPRIVDITQRRW